MILVPTLNRIGKLTNFIDSVKAAGTISPGLLLVDHKDYKLNDEKYQLIEALLPENWKIFRTEGVSMGDKIREVWPTIEDSDWVCLLNDDHHVITEHWDVKLLKHLDGANFVSCNDRWMAPQKAAGATIWSMPLLKALDMPIYPPQLKHLFIDDIWEKLGKASGCWKFVMNVIVEHHHALKDPAKVDSTHEKVYSQSNWIYDETVYKEFMEKKFAETVGKIIEFRKAQFVSVSNTRGQVSRV